MPPSRLWAQRGFALLWTSQGFRGCLVGTTYLAGANVRLATSNSIARVSGPAFAGVLAQALLGGAILLPSPLWTSDT